MIKVDQCEGVWYAQLGICQRGLYLNTYSSSKAKMTPPSPGVYLRKKIIVEVGEYLDPQGRMVGGEHTYQQWKIRPNQIF